MQYKCDVCHDTGSMRHDSDTLDCFHCEVAVDRVALNEFVRKLGVNMTLADRIWAIHQRALAMAPKQEAPEPVAQDCGACFGTGWVSRDADIGTEQECFSCDGSGKSDDAAPAAANGALTDERAAFEADTLDLYPSAKFNRFPSGTYTDSSIETQWGAWQRRSKFAAAGPDAALVKACTEGSQVNLPDFMDWIADRLEHVYKESPNVDFVRTCRDRAKNVRAALSGAKGN